MRDTQIRVLLGERAPRSNEIGPRAREAVAQFWMLQSRAAVSDQ